MPVATLLLTAMLFVASSSHAGWCPLNRSACGIKGLPSSVVEGIIMVESGGNPWALHVGIGKGYSFYPGTRVEAQRFLAVSLALTDNVDIGLMQINWQTWRESVRALGLDALRPSQCADQYEDGLPDSGGSLVRTWDLSWRVWAVITPRGQSAGAGTRVGCWPRHGRWRQVVSTVIVTEKPSVAREIAAVIDAAEKRDGYLQTKDGNRIVTWAFGHLVRYAAPDEYGAAWSGKWSLAHLPMIPDDWLLKVPGEDVKQFGIVERLMNSAERLVCATDAGREGEHIFRLIYSRAGCLAPVERLWVSSLTREALKSGLANLLPGRAFDSLAQAAEARAKADWLVGFKPDAGLFGQARHDTQRRPGADPYPGPGGAGGTNRSRASDRNRTGKSLPALSRDLRPCTSVRANPTNREWFRGCGAWSAR